MIVGVAIRRPDGTVESKPRPARHNDLRYDKNGDGMLWIVEGEQGFVDEDGKFYTRGEARKHVDAIGQRIVDRGRLVRRTLFSEDLW